MSASGPPALEAACGAYLLFRRTADGASKSPTPDEMARLLATRPGKGRESHWYLECRRPDPTLMKELQHRLMGRPTQTVDVGGSQPVTIQIVHQQIEPTDGGV